MKCLKCYIKCAGSRHNPPLFIIMFPEVCPLFCVVGKTSGARKGLEKFVVGKTSGAPRGATKIFEVGHSRSDNSGT